MLPFYHPDCGGGGRWSGWSEELSHIPFCLRAPRGLLGGKVILGSGSVV